MNTNDIPLSPVGVEDPKIHTIAVDGVLFNVAIELQLIAMIGASINSVSSEYRQFNSNCQKINNLFRNESPNKQASKLFHGIKKTIYAKVKNGVLTEGGIELKDIAYSGIDYTIIYFLLMKHHGYNEEQFVILNSFAVIIPVFHIFDKILHVANAHVSAVDLKSFSEYILDHDNAKNLIGSKLFCITRFQIENTTDISQPIWKSMYINRILRNIPTEQKGYFSPSIGWGLIRCVAKQLFTNDNLIGQVAFGENINFIRRSAMKQSRLASELMVSNLHEHSLNEIKRITNDLTAITIDMDYSLGDLSIVVFYPHIGSTFYREVMNYMEDSKSNEKLETHNIVHSCISTKDGFKDLIFQFLYSTYILAKNGIIHNDPHLNNILITKHSKRTDTQEIAFDNNKVLSMDAPKINITLIDFDKSLLSHHHTNDFDKTRKMINEEVTIVYNSVKKTVVEDYNQVFSCYVMYDVIRFGLSMRTILEEVERVIGDLLPKNIITENIKFLDNIIKLATDTLYKIYNPHPKFDFDPALSHGSIEWLIWKTFKDYAKVNKTKSSLIESSYLVKMHSSPAGDKPEFVSSRRKYTDALKYNFISQYVSNLLK